MPQVQALTGHLSYSRYGTLCYKAFRENENNFLQMINEVCSFCFVSTSTVCPHWPGISRGEEGSRERGRTLGRLLEKEVKEREDNDYLRSFHKGLCSITLASQTCLIP